MDDSRFDLLIRHLTEAGSRRRMMGVLGLSALIAGGLETATLEADARRKRRRRRRRRKGGKGGKKAGGSKMQLRELCTPGKSTCASGLQCDSPTTRHSCSSTVDGINAWCCVPPGGRCTECDCCGDNYCNGDGVCETNPEG
jgi:hypothetical protein